MYELFVNARVRPDKRDEFVLSVRALVDNASGVRGKALVAAALGDENLICCHASWDSSAALKKFLDGDGFRALRGAVRTLAEGGDLLVMQGMGSAEDWARSAGRGRKR